MSQIDQQLEDLRSRLREIRVAQKWLQEYRVNAPVTLCVPLNAFYNWLSEQEARTIDMGKKLKAYAQNGKH